MADEFLHQGTVPRPQPCCAVIGGGGELLAIGAKTHAVHPALMANEFILLNPIGAVAIAIEHLLQAKDRAISTIF